LLDLKKFNANQVETEGQRWLKFFKDGERLNDEALPDWMITQKMKQAMKHLKYIFRKRSAILSVSSPPRIPPRATHYKVDPIVQTNNALV